MYPLKFTGIFDHTVENSSGYGVAPQKRLDVAIYVFALLFAVRLVPEIFSWFDDVALMRLQLPKIRMSANPHEYWVFETCCFYKIAAEQKARLTYDNILRLVDDPDIIEPIKFLREREIVHYQRFSEAIAITQETYEGKCNFYAYNPAFDKGRRM